MFKDPDSQPTACSITITITAAALLGLGVVMVVSASASLTAPSIVESPLKNSSARQAIFTICGLLTLLGVSLCPYTFWRLRKRPTWQPAILIGLIALTLIAIVLIPGIGEQRNGARRWLPLGPAWLALGFQPSEVAKLGMVILLAAMCGHAGGRLRRFWTGFLPAILVVGLFVMLVGIEDFGTAILLALVGLGVVLGAGGRLSHLILISLPALSGLVYLVLMRPNRVQRLLTFMHPEADPQGLGYQPLQSLLTIASGGWWGKGLGAGVQKYGYLPEGRTDFIFAVICEELGIVGGIAVIALFAILLWQGRKAMTGAPNEFGRLLALGVSLTIGLQAAMNIAVVTVSVPTKGISLPLVSAGGTGVIFFSIMVGLLANIARYRSTGLQQAVAPAPPPGESRKTVTAEARSSSAPQTA